MTRIMIAVAAVTLIGLSPLIEAKENDFIEVRKDWRKATYYYTVITASKVKKVGIVKAGTHQWTCYGNTCFTIMTGGGAKNPSIGMCQGLAKLIGPITQYGHTGRKLNQEQLKACNRR